MKKSDAKSLQVLDPVKEVVQLYQKLGKQKNPSEEDVGRLRRLLVATPGAWWLATYTMPSIRQSLIEKMNCVGPSRSCLLAEVDILKKQFGYQEAPPLERLLIDNILTVRLRLIDAENRYNNIVVGNSVTLQQGQYWDNLLSSAQARFLRAIETLARVRRLARNAPALQINIANDGGKQVNIQGDANKQESTPAPATAPPVTA